MNATHSLARLRVVDPAAAAAAVDGLWAQLAHEDPKMFAALWRRASRRAKQHPVDAAVPAVDWLDELPPLEVAQAPVVNLLPVAVREMQPELLPV